MTGLNHLMQQNILEHESRLKHVDELMERVRNAIGHGSAQTETRNRLALLKQQRDDFSVWLTEQRMKSLDNWLGRDRECRSHGYPGRR